MKDIVVRTRADARCVCASTLRRIDTRSMHQSGAVSRVAPSPTRASHGRMG
ncbi:hypothetical protein PUN28_017246 [Cardiocondyla obscurior]|uniref:Uncharacterized protein n=1 Tax=Cardiocondyla obscurior TaxID=286306 RepID=A0AAW2EN36_9HYME